MIGWVLFSKKSHFKLLSRITLEFLIYAHETFQIVVEALARFSSAAAAEQAAIERSKEAS